ncbi:hypothetical protein L484_018173 [Morus notabilis]|uniref:Uncharacterized protein n=1 Tax=Morus notabilis TaxID=981085 RepID=W9R9R2_9ROSA|nr:hypothetical protein L484_018173 [Morus notabilis]
MKASTLGAAMVAHRRKVPTPKPATSLAVMFSISSSSSSSSSFCSFFSSPLDILNSELVTTLSAIQRASLTNMNFLFGSISQTWPISSVG